MGLVAGGMRLELTEEVGDEAQCGLLLCLFMMFISSKDVASCPTFCYLHTAMHLTKPTGFFCSAR